MSFGYIIKTIIVGLIVGVLARFFYPGAVSMGWIATAVLGVAGAFFAGLVIALINRRASEPMHPAGFLASIIGAMVLIWLGRMLGFHF